MSPAALFVLTGWLANACAVAWAVRGMDMDDPETRYFLRHSLWTAMAPWACVLAIAFALYLDEDNTQ